MQISSLIAALMLSGMLSACSLIPEYERPVAPVPGQWPLGSAYPAQAGDQQADIAWQSFFQDPDLQQLIGTALDNNRDLRIAALRVEAFRAQHRIQRSDLFPSIAAEASGVRQRLPADLSPSGTEVISSQYSVSLGLASYELDFFGRVRSLESQALEQYLASEEAQRSARISLIAEVANGWLAWRSDRDLLIIAQNTRQAYENSLRMIQQRVEVGTAADLVLTQASSALYSAKVQEARYQRLVAQDQHALQQLVGKGFSVEQIGFGKLQEAILADLPVGLPADLLQNRPDILAAEHRLKSANASIGAARAAFFPRISLTASGGTASSELSGLFESGSKAWTFAPQLSLPIFNAGRLAGNLEYAKIQKEIQVSEYERAIQTAFREVADGLAARGTYVSQLQSERGAVDNAHRYLDLAEQRYGAGVDDYLTVLDAQRALFGAEQQLLVSRSNQLSSEIALYKALGGGRW